jgi:P27 family predicted phage terminase small subunit
MTKQTIRLPKPTIKLTEKEGAFFTSVCKHLQKNKALEGVDAYQITQFAKCWGRYEYAERMIDEDPDELIQTFEGGARNVGPMYTIMERERAMFDKFSRRFGLNVEAREKLLHFKEDANQPKGIIAKMQAIRKKAKKAI